MINCIPDLKIDIFINHNCLYTTEIKGIFNLLVFLSMFISGTNKYEYSFHFIFSWDEHTSLFVSGIYMYMGGSIIVLSALHFPQNDCPGSNSNDYIRIAENQRCKPSPLVQSRRLERENCSSYWMSYDILWLALPDLSGNGDPGILAPGKTTIMWHCVILADSMYLCLPLLIYFLITPECVPIATAATPGAEIIVNGTRW